MTLTPIGRPTKAESQRKNSIAQQRASGAVAQRQTLPEYLLFDEVQALLRCAPNPMARLLMLEQWRAGLRVSEALGLEPQDLQLNTEQPTLRVRWQTAKGSKERIVPVHPELQSALISALSYGNISKGPIIKVDRTTAWRWVRQATNRAIELGVLPAGKKIGTHTLRHSFARHCLASGVAINRLSVWLGHASLQTTLIYLQILPDPGDDMARVP